MKTESRLTGFARTNRKNMTPAEAVMWGQVSKYRLGVKFRRQSPLEGFIVDFLSHQIKLIIEIDGGYHLGTDQIGYDAARTFALEQLGFRVIRFTNEQVLTKLDADVLPAIRKEIAERFSHGRTGVAIKAI